MGKVVAPTPEDFELFCKTHLPYRNWCPVCDQAKNANSTHLRATHDTAMSGYHWIPCSRMNAVIQVTAL